MSRSILAGWRNLCRGGLLLLSCSAGFAAGNAGSPAPLVTNVFELYSSITTAQGHIRAFDLTGTVLATDAGSGTLCFEDGSGAVVLQVNFQGAKIAAGQIIRLRGTNYLAGTAVGISLGTQPLVDNDGLHPPAEKEGTVFLRAGPYPVQVKYFNRTYTAQLDVSYSGPDLLKQSIPSESLWRPETNAAGEASGRIQGLNYRCFEGNLNKLADFDGLRPVKTGVVSNFDISVATRPEYSGVEYTGFLDIPGDGDYTFHLNSDDGSQLFLYPTPPNLTPLGTAQAPDPVPIVPGQTLPAGRNSLWAEVEGEVTFLSNSKKGAEMELSAGGRQIRVKLQNIPEGIPSHLLHRRLRVRGICPPVWNAQGQACAGLIVGTGWQSVRFLDISQENGTVYKHQTLSDLEHAVAMGERSGIAHLYGDLYASPATQRVHFKDETGSAPIELLSDTGVNSKTPVNCITRWYWNGTNLLLQQAIASESPNGKPAASDKVPVLTTALQVQQLKPEEAQQKYPVELQGIITWLMLQNDTPSLVVQDTTRAVFVSMKGNSPSPSLDVGDFCRIKGVTLPGEFSPVVELEDLTVLGRGQQPQPISPTRDQLVNGSLDAQFVELRGMVIAAHGSYVTLLTQEGTFDFHIAPEPEGSWGRLTNTIIRVRGCLFADWDKKTHRIILDHPVLRLWAATTVVDVPPPADMFQIDKVKARDLLGFDAKFNPLQWVKISGAVIHGDSDLYYMMDGSIGLRFRPVQPQHFDPGDEVEVVGLVELGGASPLLRQATARKTGHVPLPEPRLLSLDTADGQFDSTWVSVEGTLVDVKNRGTEEVFEMQVGVKSFLARLKSSREMVPPWELGSRLRLTGVFHVLDQKRTADRGVSSFELLLNSPAAVQILARPPWWTLGRLLMAATALAVGLALAGVWIGLLRRQVERRTLQLRHEIGQREEAEKMRAVEAERSRIARDLHDDLGSKLTEISMLASHVPGRKIEPENAVDRLEEIAEQSRSMISALDGVIWVVNAKNDTLSSLIEYLASSAEEFLAKAGVACRVAMPEKPPERIISADARHDVLLVVQEAFNNAVRHGRPTTVFLRFVISEGNLEIVIKDDGCGFARDKASPGNGLGNMQTRMEKLGGRCRIESSPNEGTSVILTLPPNLFADH